MSRKSTLESLYRLYELDISKLLTNPDFKKDFDKIDIKNDPLFLRDFTNGNPIVNINAQASGAYVLHYFLEHTDCLEFSKEETALLLEIALDHDLSKDEIELANDMTEVCLFLDFDNLGTLSELIYSICDKNVWRYHFDRFLPVQLCLYHIFGTEEEKTAFWQETYYIADTYRAFVNITAKRFQPK